MPSAVTITETPVPNDPIKIVALNIDSGGGDRVPRICAYLDAQQADVVILTEWRDTAEGQAIVAWSTGKGMHCHGLADGGKANGVFVASVCPFTASSRTPPGNTTGVLLLAQAPRWTVLACYFPQRHDKPPFFRLWPAWRLHTPRNLCS